MIPIDGRPPRASLDHTYHTPAAIARALGLAKVDCIYKLIARGELAAVNVAAGRDRPCWRISQQAFDQFVAARTAGKPAAPAARPRKPRREVTRYF